MHLTLLHLERPKEYTILAFMGAIGFKARCSFQELLLYLQYHGSKRGLVLL